MYYELQIYVLSPLRQIAQKTIISCKLKIFAPLVSGGVYKNRLYIVN